MNLIQVKPSPEAQAFVERMNSISVQRTAVAPTRKYTGTRALSIAPDGTIYSGRITMQDFDKRYVGR